MVVDGSHRRSPALVAQVREARSRARSGACLVRALEFASRAGAPPSAVSSLSHRVTSTLMYGYAAVLAKNSKNELSRNETEHGARPRPSHHASHTPAVAPSGYRSIPTYLPTSCGDPAHGSSSKGTAASAWSLGRHDVHHLLRQPRRGRKARQGSESDEKVITQCEIPKSRFGPFAR